MHCLGMALCLVLPAVASAQDAVTANVPEVRVVAEAESDETIQAPYLPPVQGTRIYSGKKTSVIDLDEFPRITNNNYRQALAKTPGLYLSEETTPLLALATAASIRSSATLSLKDGSDSRDQFGFRKRIHAAARSVDRLDSSCARRCLWAPGWRPIHHTPPRTDRPSLRNHQYFCSDINSNFTYVEGTTGRSAILLQSPRSVDSREAHSASFRAAHLKLVLDANTGAAGFSRSSPRGRTW